LGTDSVLNFIIF